jgi:hypothetical protein
MLFSIASLRPPGFATDCMLGPRPGTGPGPRTLERRFSYGAALRPPPHALRNLSPRLAQRRYAGVDALLPPTWQDQLNIGGVRPPAAMPPEPRVVQYGGGEVQYRFPYLADGDDPRTAFWLHRQAKYLDAVAAHLPIDPGALRAEIESIEASHVPIDNLQAAGGRLFHLQGGVLKVWQPDTPIRTVFDPAAAGADSCSRCLRSFKISPDGAHALLFLEQANDYLVRVLDTTNGQLLPQRYPVPPHFMAWPAWLDAQSFLIGPPAPPADTPLPEQWLGQKLHAYRIGTDPGDAPLNGLVFDPVRHGLPPECRLTAGMTGDYAFVRVDIGNDLYDGRLYVKRRDALEGDAGPWREVLAGQAISNAAGHGNTLYVACHQHAANGRVLAVDLDRLDSTVPSPVLPETDCPISSALFYEALRCDSQGLYVKRLVVEPARGYGNEVWFVPHGQPQAAQRLDLPLSGLIEQLVVDPSQVGVSFILKTFNGGYGHYRFDPATQAVRPSGLIDTVEPIEGLAVTLDMAPRPAPEEGAIAHVVVRPEGAPPGAGWLEIFGSYGTPLRPLPRALLELLRRHNVAAVLADIRGGASQGTQSYHAGWRENRLAGMRDAASLAQYQADKGVVLSGRFVLSGFSANGVNAVQAALRYPDIFPVVLVCAGVVDITRKEDCANGLLDVAEFTTRETLSGLRAQLAADPYHAALAAADAGQPTAAIALSAGGSDVNVVAGPLRELAEILQHGQPADGVAAPLVVFSQHPGDHDALEGLDAVQVAFALSHVLHD